MKIPFCQNCGRLMHMKHGKAICECGEVRDFHESEKTSKEIMKKSDKAEGVVEDKNPFATYPHICKKCGYDKAQLTIIEPGQPDADQVIRFKCGKCHQTEQAKINFT